MFVCSWLSFFSPQELASYSRRRCSLPPTFQTTTAYPSFPCPAPEEVFTRRSGKNNMMLNEMWSVSFVRRLLPRL